MEYRPNGRLHCMIQRFSLGFSGKYWPTSQDVDHSSERRRGFLRECKVLPQVPSQRAAQDRSLNRSFREVATIDSCPFL